MMPTSKGIDMSMVQIVKAIHLDVKRGQSDMDLLLRAADTVMQYIEWRCDLHNKGFCILYRADLKNTHTLIVDLFMGESWSKIQVADLLVKLDSRIRSLDRVVVTL